MNTIKALVVFAKLMGLGLLVGLVLIAVVTMASILAILANPVVGAIAIIGVFILTIAWHIRYAPKVSMS